MHTPRNWNQRRTRYITWIDCINSYLVQNIRLVDAVCSGNECDERKGAKNC